MRRTITLLSAATFALVLMAGPAVAGHPHQMHNPGGCVDIRVDTPGQIHEGDDEYPARGNGNKFHGAAHVGAAVDFDADTGTGTLGKGNSPVTVRGGSCDD